MHSDKDSQNKNELNKTEIKQKRLSNVPEDSSSNYPTLRASDKYPRENHSPKKEESFSQPPPQIDRNSKPSRFRSAHERLFGSKSIQVVNSSSTADHYHNDDSDYINTSSPPKYEETDSKSVTSSTNGHHQRIVTGAFGDTLSYNSDSYNKYGNTNSTSENNGLNTRSTLSNEQYRLSRRSAPQTVSHSSSKQSSLERSKPLPSAPHLNGTKIDPLPTSSISTFSKTPPSPPPKPNSKYGQSLQYQM